MSARLTDAELSTYERGLTADILRQDILHANKLMATELKELRDHVEAIAETGACCGPCDWFGICPACTIRLELKP